MYRLFLSICLLFVIGVTACGGGGSKNNNNNNNSNNQSPPSGSLPAAPAVAAPQLVTVSSTQPVTGVNVITGAPAITPVINVLNAGVLGATGGFAANTGVMVSRTSGTATTIIMFGPGLASGSSSSATLNVTATISGPNDIIVSSQRGIFSTNNTPGIAFQITMTPTTALGARTIFLQGGNDITAFTGGVEITQ